MQNWDNQAIAEKLQEIADLLEQQNANPFRVNAYRRAAQTVLAHDEELAVLAEREGVELSLIHISEPTRLWSGSRMPSSA